MGFKSSTVMNGGNRTTGHWTLLTPKNTDKECAPLFFFGDYLCVSCIDQFFIENKEVLGLYFSEIKASHSIPETELNPRWV